MACSQTFSTRWDLGTHLKTVHYLKKEEDEETSEPTLVENRLLGEVFDLSQALPLIDENVPAPSEWVN